MALKEGAKIGTYKYKHNWKFLEKDSEALYYFLGFVAADGYISNNGIEIGINEKDVKILEVFRDLIVLDKPIYEKPKTNSRTLKISCKKRIPAIKNFYGIVSNKKHEEMLFPNIPDEYVKHFIRGCVDGDGCIDTTKAYKDGKIYIGPRLRVLGNKNFLQEMNNVIKKHIKHNTCSISKKGDENVFTVTYNFSTAKAILEWLYRDCSIYLDRKYKKFLEVTNLS